MKGYGFWGVGKVLNVNPVRYTANGTPWVSANIEFEDEYGRFKFHSCTAWDKTAEALGSKSVGDMVAVEGRPRWEKWTDKDGNERWSLKLNINKLIEDEQENAEKPDVGYGETGELEDVPF